MSEQLPDRIRYIFADLSDRLRDLSCHPEWAPRCDVTNGQQVQLAEIHQPFGAPVDQDFACLNIHLRAASHEDLKQQLARTHLAVQQEKQLLAPRGLRTLDLEEIGDPTQEEQVWTRKLVYRAVVDSGC